MSRNNIINQPIAEGFTAGVSAITVSSIWLWAGAFHPFVVFVLYIIGLYCITISTIWILSKGESPLEWFLKHPAFFFIVGFIWIALIVLFLDLHFFEFWSDFKDVLVELHGLVFDFLFLGVLLALYNQLRQKKQEVNRWKEELHDYKGWTENEAAYRIAGIIRRLQDKKVELGKEELSNLHLGQCSKEIIKKAIMLKVKIASLQGANLRDADLKNANLLRSDLKNANLKDANLQNANLLMADLQNANLQFTNLNNAILANANLLNANLLNANLQNASLLNANLENTTLEYVNLLKTDLIYANLTNVRLANAKVDTIDWIDRLNDWQVIGKELIKIRYDVNPTPYKDFYENDYYIIREKEEAKKKYLEKLRFSYFDKFKRR